MEWFAYNLGYAIGGFIVAWIKICLGIVFLGPLLIAPWNFVAFQLWVAWMAGPP